MGRVGIYSLPRSCETRGSRVLGGEGTTVIDSVLPIPREIFETSWRRSKSFASNMIRSVGIGE
jgi:hypothetical protein